MWSAVRWMTFRLMGVGNVDLAKSGIHSPTDIMKLPWDNDEDNSPSDEDIDDIRKTLRAMREEKRGN